MKKTIVIFSLLIVALLILFQLSKYSIFFKQASIELVTVVTAVIFLIIGIYLNKKSLQKRQPDIEGIDRLKIEALSISKREYEVLQMISDGLSNKEIAKKLYLSESTVKSHVSSLFLKLDSKRRTQAIKKAKNLGIID